MAKSTREVDAKELADVKKLNKRQARKKKGRKGRKSGRG